MRPKGSKNMKPVEKVKEVQPIIQEKIVNEIVENDPVIESVPEKAIVTDVKPEATYRREYWEVTKWKGVVDVLKCRNCGHCESDADKKDKMILHVITHVAKSEQDKLFDRLVKEY
jgi:hypothetical protein